MRQLFSQIAKSKRLVGVVEARRRIPGLVPGLPKTRQALAYAERAHSGQHRDVDGAAFIAHPAEVAALLDHADRPDHVIAAGALHDTAEKTATNVTDLRTRFGPRITTLVLAVTDDDHITDYQQRKAAEREQAASAGDEALMILAADKISKVRELQLETATARRRSTPISSESWLLRFAHYHECLRLLERQLLDSPLVANLHAEVERLPDALTHHPFLTGTTV
jgi:(p)ppGpp synthase/HD superfamily hydrolase